LPITSLAQDSKRPAQFIGRAFLLAGRAHDAGRDHSRQADWSRRACNALDYVRPIRKTPIVVNDSRGFFRHRCVLNYIREGHLNADGRRAGRDDREMYGRMGHAGRAAVASMTR